VTKLIEEDIPGGLWRKRQRVMQRYFQVGIVGDNGFLRWVKWEKVREQCSELISDDFMRLLGKGSGYRFNLGFGKPKSFQGLKIYNKFLSVDGGRTPHYLSEALERMLTTTEEYFKSTNVVNFQRLNSFLRELRSSGWIVRKEDRGPRFVLCSIQWEKNICKNFSQQYNKYLQGLKMENLREDQSSTERVARLYFIPKTQKPISEPMKGRPIVSFLGVVDKAYLQKFVKLINQWVIDQRGYDCIRTDVAITLHGSRRRFIIGDLESMFTSVPRKLFLDWLDNSDISRYSCIAGGRFFTGNMLIYEIKRIVEGLLFQYEGQAWEMTEGLPMGHPLSPPIARAVVTWRERFVQLQQKLYKDIICTRYVDDVKISVPDETDGPYAERDLAEMRRSYENAIAPMRIEWRDGDRRYMDSETHEDGEMEFVKNKPTGYIPDELPESIKVQVLKAEVRRRYARGDNYDQIGDDLYYMDENSGEILQGSGWSHIDEYLDFHGIPVETQKQRYAVTAPTPKKRTGELLHVPYTGYIRTRNGKMLKKYLEDTYCKSYWEGVPHKLKEPRFVGIHWDIMSKKSFTTICTKSRHYRRSIST
jgi:hypothetical protein